MCSLLFLFDDQDYRDFNHYYFVHPFFFTTDFDLTPDSRRYRSKFTQPTRHSLVRTRRNEEKTTPQLQLMFGETFLNFCRSVPERRDWFPDGRKESKAINFFHTRGRLKTFYLAEKKRDCVDAIF